MVDPLFDLAGEVIGINTAVIPDTNLGFAVPINTAKEMLPQLLGEGQGRLVATWV